MLLLKPSGVGGRGRLVEAALVTTGAWLADAIVRRLAARMDVA